MRRLATTAYRDEASNIHRLPLVEHALSVAEVVEAAFTESGELTNNPKLEEDIYLAALGHNLYEYASTEPDLVRFTFGDRVHAYIEALTRRQDDPNRTAYLARHQGAAGPARLIRLAELIDNTAVSARDIARLHARWVNSTFVNLGSHWLESAMTADLKILPRTSALLQARLRAEHGRLLARLAAQRSLDAQSAMMAANEVAKNGSKGARKFDPAVAEDALRLMKEQEWREAMLVRSTYLFA